MNKRLVKSKEKMLFGVCGGLGEYLDVDPTVIRIIFVIALVMFGTGLLLYLVLAIVMPSE